MKTKVGIDSIQVKVKIVYKFAADHLCIYPIFKSTLGIQKSHRRLRMFSSENNVIRPRKNRATEAWINQHHPQQQLQRNIFNVIEHSNYAPVYDKNNKFQRNENTRFVVK